MFHLLLTFGNHDMMIYFYWHLLCIFKGQYMAIMQSHYTGLLIYCIDIFDVGTSEHHPDNTWCTDSYMSMIYNDMYAI